MAKIPLNRPRTIPIGITTESVGIYTCPIGVSAYVLLLNVSNISSGEEAGTYTVTAKFERPFIEIIDNQEVQGITTRYIVNELEVPVNDAANLIPDGRLVLENDPTRATTIRDGGDTLKISANSDGKLELLLSVLETAKQ